MVNRREVRAGGRTLPPARAGAGARIASPVRGAVLPRRWARAVRYGPAMRRSFTFFLCLFACTVAAAPAAAQARSCGHFTIGKSNSTSNPDGKLPAHGSATGASCRVMRRIARRLHDGTYKVPDGKRGIGRFGSAFAIRDAGRSWSCRLMWIGSSGPSYRMRCSSGGARLAWEAGQ